MAGEVGLMIFVAVFVGGFGYFSYLLAQDQMQEYSVDMPAENYTTPDSTSFWDTTSTMFTLNFSAEETKPLLTALIGTPITIIGVYLFLRYLRGI